MSALKINNFAVLGKKSIKLLFNLCLIWKQFQNMRYKQDKVHLLKKPKSHCFYFLKTLTWSWNVSCLAVISINNQVKIHVNSSFKLSAINRGKIWLNSRYTLLICTYVCKAMEVLKQVTSADCQILYMHDRTPENLIFWLAASTWTFNEWRVGSALFRVTKEFSKYLKWLHLQWAL